jgi:hypothetical protein
MQGRVYQITSTRYGNQPHLYVVVLEFSGNKDCLVVPAFSDDGFMVNSVIKARTAEGYRLDQIVVTLDNSQHIQFVTQHTGKQAHWLVSDVDRLPVSEVTANPFLGTMDATGLRQLAAGLLEFAKTTDRFSNTVLKKLRQLID